MRSSPVSAARHSKWASIAPRRTPIEQKFAARAAQRRRPIPICQRASPVDITTATIAGLMASRQTADSSKPCRSGAESPAL